MQRDILSQEEIHVLVGHEFTDEPDEQEERKEQSLDSSVAVPYDFSAHGELSSGRIHALDLIHGRFCRIFSQSFSGFVSRLVEVELCSSTIIPFAEFIRTLPLPTSLHMFTMRPLHGMAVMALDSTLVLSIIDCLLGGVGHTRLNVEGREFTPIEQRIVAKVALLALEELEKAWAPVHPLKIHLERSEVNPHLITMVASKDLVLLAMLQVHLWDTSAFIRLCIPHALFQPLKRVLDGSLHTAWVDVDQNWTAGLRREVLQAEVELVVELGEASIDTQQFLALNPGDIIPLLQGVNEPLVVKVQNVPKAKALPGTLHGNRAIKLASVIA